MPFFCSISYFFFFNDPAPTGIYTLSLHDALPISRVAAIICAWFSGWDGHSHAKPFWTMGLPSGTVLRGDRKSTRLNSSHGYISYAVFCLKKKKKTNQLNERTHQCNSTIQPCAHSG